MAVNIKKTTEQTEQYVNTDGEILDILHTTSSSVQSVRLSNEPEYIKIYLDVISILNNYPKAINKILISVLLRMSYAGARSGGQVVHLLADDREQIAQECGVTVKRVDQALVHFRNAGLLVRVPAAKQKEGQPIKYAKGKYLVNANYFGRGTWSDISEIRSAIVFSEGKLSVKNDFLYKNGEEHSST